MTDLPPIVQVVLACGAVAFVIEIIWGDWRNDVGLESVGATLVGFVFDWALKWISFGTVGSAIYGLVRFVHWAWYS